MEGDISIAALALQRSSPNAGAIVAANPAGTPFMTGADFDFGWSPGIDAAVGVGLFGNEAIEARVMYSSFGCKRPDCHASRN